MHQQAPMAPAVAALVLAAGCASTPDRYHELRADFDRLPHPTADARERAEDPFAGASELSRAALVQAVLERNPSLEAARQAWVAATADIPGEVALDDPMLSYRVAPLSPFDEDVRFGQEVMLSQRFPWPGKRRARGEVAAAEAEAAQSSYLAARLELALAAAMLYDDYVRVTRAIEINDIHLELLDDAQEGARAEFEAGRATLQDPLQAEVESSHLRHRQLALEGELDSLVARINGLLHRAQDRPLPPPPGERVIPTPIDAPLDRLIAEAIEARTELDAREAELRAGEASLELARAESYPDLGVSASYNSMWGELSHQIMVGLSLNLPIWRERRTAGVDRARARIARARAERDHVSSEIAAEVVAMQRRSQESFHVVHHYRDQILPASRDRVDAAQAAFLSGDLSFFAVVDALRVLRTNELEYEEHIAQLYQRLAALERALGRLPGLAAPQPSAEEEMDHDHD